MTERRTVEVTRNKALPPKFYRTAEGRYFGQISGLRRITEVRDEETGELIETKETAENPVVPNGLIEAPEPPPDGVTYVWDGAAWAQDENLKEEAASADAAQRISAPEQKALVDTFHDLENRIRALEGRPSVTKAQVRQALAQRVKGHL